MRTRPNRNIFCAALTLAIVAFLALPATAQASIFVVNTTDDLDDGMCDVNHCSLREAINAANTNSGPDSIHFDLPGSGGSTNTIELDSMLPILTDDATIIDGTTEPDYAGSPVVFIHQSLSSMGVEVGLAVESNNNEIRGLILAGFGTWLDPNNVPFHWAGGAIYVYGSGNLIENNTIGQGAWWNTVGVRLSGPANSVIGNVISGNGIGVYVDHPNNLIQGNIVGPDADGATPVHNDTGIWLDDGADGTLVGGTGTGEGNTISANQHVGLAVDGDHCYIYGNLIGTNSTGNGAVPNAYNGVVIYGDDTHLGGPASGEGNLISGNGGHGVWLSIASENSVIQGNYIGTDIGGTWYIPNGWSGIESEADGLIIGGASAGMGNLIMGNTGAGLNIDDLGRSNFVMGNTIAANGSDGIRLSGFEEPVNHNTFSQNSIYDNGQLGIDTDGLNDGILPPVLNGGFGTTVSGTACSNCLIEIFVAEADPTGYGEGKEFLADGVASAGGAFSIPVSPPGFCTLITATATDGDGNTSEFSLNVHVNCLYFEPLFLYPIWVFIITVFGVIGWLIRRARPTRPVGLIPFTALGGGVLFLVLILALPFVEVEFIPRSAGCGNGVVDPGETCDGDDLSLCTSDQVCMNCRCVTEIEWPVCGDGDVDEGEQCDGDDLSMCRSDQVCENCRCITYIEAEEETEEEPEEVAPEPELCVYEALQNTNCRMSDYPESELVAILMEGDTVPLLALSPEYTYGLFEMGDGETCWIGLSLMGGPENPLGTCPVDLIDPPEPPSEGVCQANSDQRTCIASGGEWVSGPAPYCICPEE